MLHPPCVMVRMVSFWWCIPFTLQPQRLIRWPKSTSAVSSEKKSFRTLVQFCSVSPTWLSLTVALCRFRHAALDLQSSCWFFPWLPFSDYILVSSSWLVYFTNFFIDLFRMFLYWFLLGKKFFWGFFFFLLRHSHFFCQKCNYILKKYI